MQFFRKTKLNNEGSTFVFIVVGLMFIGVLGTLILALTSSSFKMRNVDYRARQTFYSGEEYSSRIYSELGMNAMGVLGEAYVTTMGKMTSGDIHGQTELNDYLKKLFYKNMLINLHLVDKNIKDEDVLPEYKFTADNALVSGAEDPTKPNSLEVMLQKIVDPTATDVKVYINDASSTEDDAYVKVVCDIDGGVSDSGETYPLITIHDVHLQYLNNTDLYEANYTFDIVLCYPEWDFAFSSPTSAATDIDTFLDYVMISNDMILFDDVTATVQGCVSTGDNRVVADNSDNTGLVIDGSDVDFIENPNNRYEPLAVVVTDNVRIDGSVVNPSSMNFANGRLWCNSIIVDREPALDSTVAVGSSFVATSGVGTSNRLKLYIQDDLQLDGDYSSATVSGGAYFGYGSGKDTVNKIAQNSSSSIIVNGNYSKIRLYQIGKMYINGLSYLNFGDNNYRTGESLSVKGNQDAYLVPSAYMGGTQANPVRAGNTIDLNDLKNALVGANSTFFGRTYLDQDEPFVQRTYSINDKQYVFFYLNFSTYTNERKYVEYVLNTEAGNDAVLKDVQDRIYKNLSKMRDDKDAILELIDVDKNNSFTAGALVTANGGELTGTAHAEMFGEADANTIAQITQTTQSIRNRYLLMKSLLLPVVGSTDTDNEPTVSTFASVHSMDLWYKLNHPAQFPDFSGTEYRSVIAQHLNNSAVENIINTTKLNQYTNSEPAGIWQREHNVTGGDATITYVTPRFGNGSGDGVSVQNGVVRIAGGYRGVVVVDGSVEITGSVTGLVIATGGITIVNGGTLTSDAEMVDELMKAEQDKNNDSCHSSIENAERRSDVFKFYPVNGSIAPSSESINQLKYTDVIYFDNWRKYEDTRFYGVTTP